MARIRWHGSEFQVSLISQYANGDWLARAREHGPRFTIGTEIRVRPNEIVSTDDNETDKPVATQASLEAAMAAERKDLPTVRELIEGSRKSGTLPRPKPPEPDGS